MSGTQARDPTQTISGTACQEHSAGAATTVTVRPLLVRQEAAVCAVGGYVQ